MNQPPPQSPPYKHAMQHQGGPSQPPPPSSSFKPYPPRSPPMHRSRSHSPPNMDQMPPNSHNRDYNDMDDDMNSGGPSNYGGGGHYNDRYRPGGYSHHRSYNPPHQQHGGGGYRPYKKFGYNNAPSRPYPYNNNNRNYHHQPYNNYRPKKHHYNSMPGNSPPHIHTPPMPPSPQSSHSQHSPVVNIHTPPPPPPQQPSNNNSLTPLKTQNQFQLSPFGRSPSMSSQSPMFPPSSQHHFNQYNAGSYSSQDANVVGGYSSPSPQPNQQKVQQQYGEMIQPPPVEEDPQLTQQRHIIVEQQKRLKEALTLGPEFVIDETYNQEMYDTLVEVNKLREMQYSCQRQYSLLVNACNLLDARVFHTTIEYEQAKSEDEFYEKMIQKYKDELSNLTNKHQQMAAQQSQDETSNSIQ
jgi:hypothetical protein